MKTKDFYERKNKHEKTKTRSRRVTKQRCALTTMVTWQAHIPGSNKLFGSLNGTNTWKQWNTKWFLKKFWKMNYFSEMVLNKKSSISKSQETTVSHSSYNFSHKATESKNKCWSFFYAKFWASLLGYLPHSGEEVSVQKPLRAAASPAVFGKWLQHQIEEITFLGHQDVKV